MVCKSGIECRKPGVGARLALTPKRDSLLCEVHGPTFLEGASLAPDWRACAPSAPLMLPGSVLFSRRRVSIVGHWRKTRGRARDQAMWK
jgi:hypothetical protein